jgi:hypothetical protein
MSDPDAPTDPPPPPVHLLPRTVTWRHAFAWYEDAMRLFKLSPFTFIGLALVTIATELLLKAAPGALSFASEIFTPLVACGLVYAAAAADRGEVPSMWFAVQAFRAGGGAIASVIVASLVAFAAQAFAGWWIADANLLLPDGVMQLSLPAILGIYAISTLAALPVTFLPPLALFERVPLPAALVASATAFAQNTVPLLIYAAISLVLLCFGVLTAGLGLALALPLWAAATYAAWKDVYGVRDPPNF